MIDQKLKDMLHGQVIDSLLLLCGTAPVGKRYSLDLLEYRSLSNRLYFVKPKYPKTYSLDVENSMVVDFETNEEGIGVLATLHALNFIIKKEFKPLLANYADHPCIDLQDQALELFDGVLSYGFKHESRLNLSGVIYQIRRPVTECVSTTKKYAGQYLRAL